MTWLVGIKGAFPSVWVVSHDAQGYVTLTNAAAGKVLDVKGGKAVVGTQVQQCVANGAYAQKWIVRKTSSGSYELLSALGEDLLLGVVLDCCDAVGHALALLALVGESGDPLLALHVLPVATAGGACGLQTGGAALARAACVEEPWLGLNERGDVAVVLRQERFRGGDGAGARASEHEPRALVGEMGLEGGDILAEPLRRLVRPGGLGNLRLERLDLGVLGLELCDVAGAVAPAHLVLLGRLLALLLLRVDVLLLPALLLVLALPGLALRLLHATELTLHCDRLSASCGQQTKRNARTF